MENTGCIEYIKESLENCLICVALLNMAGRLRDGMLDSSNKGSTTFQKDTDQ